MTGRVLSIGECMVEFFDRGDGCWRRGFAGDTLNVAWALRALLPEAVPVDYLTRVGGDAVSGAMLGFIREAGIGIGFVSRDPQRTVGLYTIATNARGERSFSYWRDGSAARLLAEDPAHLGRAMAGAGLVYLSGITAAILGETGRASLLAELARARGQGVRLAYDPNYRPRLWETVAAMQVFNRQMAGLADILLPTFDDEAAAFGDADPRATIARWTGWGCGEVVVKDGANATLVAGGGATLSRVPPAGASPVDTTGAGDSFNGGYLAARIMGQGPARALTVAQAVAARVVMQRGALAEADTLRQAAGL